MTYTLLRVVDEGVLLYAEHRLRLAPEGGTIATQFDAFARIAVPGIYAVRAGGEQLSVESRPQSRLFDGMPVRWSLSPFADRPGPFPKPPSPSAYDACRLPGVSTLLTSADGTEVLESCSAAVIGWDDRQLVLVPGDRPRVDSVTERALRERVEFATAPILCRSQLPLALVNAVTGVCLPAIAGRPEFPGAVRDFILATLTATACRP